MSNCCTCVRAWQSGVLCYYYIYILCARVVRAAHTQTHTHTNMHANKQSNWLFECTHTEHLNALRTKTERARTRNADADVALRVNVCVGLSDRTHNECNSVVSVREHRRT